MNAKARSDAHSSLAVSLGRMLGTDGCRGGRLVELRPTADNK